MDGNVEEEKEGVQEKIPREYNGVAKSWMDYKYLILASLAIIVISMLLVFTNMRIQEIETGIIDENNKLETKIETINLFLFEITCKTHDLEVNWIGEEEFSMKCRDILIEYSRDKGVESTINGEKSNWEGVIEDEQGESEIPSNNGGGTMVYNETTSEQSL